MVTRRNARKGVLGKPKRKEPIEMSKVEYSNVRTGVRGRVVVYDWPIEADVHDR